MIDTKLLKNEERAVFALRSLYKSYGYLPFKMSKFEEYDLYVQNKDFLVGDSVITFNDTDGRLLALKPDVTLSIIKNTTDERGSKQKVYYNENVYRTSRKTHRFKEIMQAGLECIGDVDIIDVFEVVYLSAKSLSLVRDDFVLDLSHMGILSALLDSASANTLFKKEFTKLISERNRHEAELLIKEYGLCEKRALLMPLIDMYGSAEEVLARLLPLCVSEDARSAYRELSELCEMLSKTEVYDRIRIDFSVMGDMNYYNGIVFKGFLSGIFEGVLTGGEYGMLMRRMGRQSGAVGFALYLDLLEELDTSREEYDVDTLLIYSEKSDTASVIAKKAELIKSGVSVFCTKALPKDIRYKNTVYMD